MFVYVVCAGYADEGDRWRLKYGSDINFKDEVEKVWQTVRPFYQQLHAFVRRKLKNFYGEKKFPQNGLIPAHLLGNMWAQSWRNLEDLVTPFPNATPINVTKALLEKVTKMPPKFCLVFNTNIVT